MVDIWVSLPNHNPTLLLCKETENVIPVFPMCT